ncbi:MAG: hypothetical protein ABSB39_08845 [Candidatus Sulfotelmatobacter sp.]
MNEGTLLGRINPVTGVPGFMPHFRLPVSLSYHGSVTEVLDIVNVTATVYLLYARLGFPAQNSAGNYLGSSNLDPYSGFGALVPGGSGTSWTFLVAADHRLLHLIEQERRGRDVILSLLISVCAIPREQQDQPKPSGITAIKVHDANTPGNAHCLIEIPKSKWLELLKAVGYGEFHLAEIPLPRIRKVKALDASLQHIQRAWEHFLNGSDRETLAACHDAFEKLAKESVNPNSKPDQMAFSKILSGIGPPKKVHKLSLLLSQCASLTQLGRHQETPPIEVDHRDAELAILLTHACIAYLSKADKPAKAKP